MTGDSDGGATALVPSFNFHTLRKRKIENQPPPPPPPPLPGHGKLGMAGGDGMLEAEQVADDVYETMKKV
jgi:hypothetical protein